MSSTSTITPARPVSSPSILDKINVARKAGFKTNLERYLRFVGVTENEPVELVSLRAKNIARNPVTLVAYATGYEQIHRLFKEADEGKPGEVHHNAEGLYLVSNLINPALAHRLRPNHWEITDARVKDGEILHRRVLAIDCDPERPSGVSATADEHKAALKKGLDVHVKLAEVLGGEAPLGFGGTGNGCHVQLRLDVSECDEADDLCQRFLGAMDRLFTGPVTMNGTKVLVKVDTTVHNAARMLPGFGTRKRKGFPSKERPHRRTWFFCSDDPRRLSLDELRALVVELEARCEAAPDQTAEKNESKKKEKKPSSSADNSKLWWDAVRAVPVADVMTWLGLSEGGKLHCPGCGSLTGAAALTEKMGVNLWKCLHDTCSAKGIGEGRYDTVALVMETKHIDDRVTAAKLIGEQFGIEPPKRGRGRPKAFLSRSDLIQQAQKMGIDIEEGANTCKTFPCTDLGNAERLVSGHEDDLLFVGDWYRWHVWDGSRWAVDATCEVTRRAHATVRKILVEAANVDDDETRAELNAWAKTSESRNRTSALIEQAQALVCVAPAKLNKQPLLVNCPNGSIDLETGELREHRRQDLITLVTSVAYEKYEPFKAPTWERCLRRWQPDEEVRGFLQRLAGYSALGEVREHILPIHNGVGRNGKGTFFETLMHVLGDYATTVPEELLIDNRHADHPTLLATLYGKRLAVASETKHGDILAMSRLKRLTGGDTISCRRMREDWWDYEPVHSLHLQTNHRPRVTDTGLAAWARLILITWGVTIPESEQDKTLKQKLRLEAPQILGWVVQGAVAYLRDGLPVPATIVKATREWRQDEDMLGLFLSECCITWEEHGKARKTGGLVVDDDWYTVSKGQLYAAYREWAEEAGHKAKGKLTFRKEMIERGLVEYREDGTGDRMWAGVGLSATVTGKIAQAEEGDLLAAV